MLPQKLMEVSILICLFVFVGSCAKKDFTPGTKKFHSKSHLAMPGPIEKTETHSNHCEANNSASCLGLLKTSNAKKRPNFYKLLNPFAINLPGNNGCILSKASQIFKLADGFVATNKNEKTYRFYTLDQVKNCEARRTLSRFQDLLSRTSGGSGQTIQSLGYSVDDRQNILKPTSFSSDIEHAIKLQKQTHGCHLSTKKLVYVFPDAVIYTNPKGESYDIFSIETAKEKNCRLDRTRDEILASCGDKPSANCIGIIKSVSTRKVHIKPAHFEQHLANLSKKISKALHGCKFSNKDNINVFSDGTVVYWSKLTNVYSAYSHKTVHTMGCRIPGFPNPHYSQFIRSHNGTGKSLESIGYSSLVEGSYLVKPASFETDMKNGRKILQKHHGCNKGFGPTAGIQMFPMIYIFPDGIVYTLGGSNYYKFFTRDHAKQAGCRF